MTFYGIKYIVNYLLKEILVSYDKLRRGMYFKLYQNEDGDTKHENGLIL